MSYSSIEDIAGLIDDGDLRYQFSSEYIMKREHSGINMLFITNMALLT
jgi:hypothetical protein